MLKSFVAAFALLVATQVFPQDKPAAAAPADSAKQAYVIEHSSTHAAFEADGTGLREWTSQIKVVADAGVKDLAVLNFTYSSANETLEIPYIRVRKPDGTVVKTPDYNIQDMPADVSRTAPLYSDIHEKHVAVKALGVGDTLEYQIRYRTVKPEVPNHFWFEYTFNKTAMVRDEEVEISFPATKQVIVSDPASKPAIREEGGRKIYSWHHANLATKSDEANSDDEEEDDSAPSIQLTTFADWEQIGEWYRALQKDAVEPTAEVKAKAAELTKGLTTDEEKIKALYNFVSLNIHYIGLDFGIGRYQPHMAQDVLENEYGDCKDKHTLFAALLRASGYDAYPVLIHSSRKLIEDVPSPTQFDHVISAVPLKGNLLWLDTTPEVAPFQLLMPALRDKKALLIPTDAHPRITKTPATSPFPQEQVFVVTGTLSKDDVFTGHFSTRFRGDVEVSFRTAYRTVAEAQWQQLAQQISGRMNYAGDVSNVQVSSPTDTSQPFRVNYDYIRKEYGDWDNRQIVLPLPPTGIEVAAFLRKAPKKPFTLGTPGTITYECRLQLPPGGSVTALNNLNLVEDFAEYHTTNEYGDGSIHTVRRLIIKKSEVPVAEWQKLKSFAKQLSDDEFSYIPVAGITDDASRTEGTGNLKAQYRAGANAIDQRDALRAKEIFEKIIAADPKYAGAHFGLASALLLHGEYEAALVNLHEEEKVNPTDERSYQTAVSVEEFLGRKSEAMQDLRDLVKASPANHEAPLALSDMLLQSGQSSSAVEVLQTAAKNSPDSPSIRLALSRAYARSGQKDKAAAVLTNPAISEADVATLGNRLLIKVATDLADAGVDPDRARRFAEIAMKKAETAPADTERKDQEPALDLALAWDALGWVYFRQGEVTKGESYIKAAWQLSQKPSIGMHLAAIYEKLGQTQKAIHMYPLVMAASDVYTGISLRTTHPDDSEHDAAELRYRKLTGKNPNLNSSDRLPNGKWSILPVEELANMRKASLGPSKGIGASAEFSIVFSSDGLEKAEFVGGDPSLKSKTDRIRTAHFDIVFPAGSKAKFVRRAELSCHDVEGCNLMLIPLQENPLTRFR